MCPNFLLLENDPSCWCGIKHHSFTHLLTLKTFSCCNSTSFLLCFLNLQTLRYTNTHSGSTNCSRFTCEFVLFLSYMLLPYSHPTAIILMNVNLNVNSKRLSEVTISFMPPTSFYQYIIYPELVLAQSYMRKYIAFNACFKLHNSKSSPKIKF